jgi:predicted amidophosphoribosyltransferase
MERSDMRNRHIPRLCRVCTAPMAGQEELCWNCGAAYTSVERTTATLATDTADDRWVDDGGHAPRTTATPVAA